MSDQYFVRGLALSRRRLLGVAAGSALAGATRSDTRVEETAASAATGSRDHAADPDPTRVPGRPPSPVGARAPQEQPQRKPLAGIVSFTPLEDLHGTLTPADLHFERHHAGIPAIDPARHDLLIHGMVERPLKFTLGDLLRFPAQTRIAFIECAGNYFPRAGDQSPVHQVCGLTSQSEWTGVPLSTLLREAGVRPQAQWIIAEGSDAAVLHRSIPIAKALDDALVVYAQNGEAIRPAQGYPMRLLLPGWEGNTNVKWLRRLEVTDRPAMGREETAKYTEPMLDNFVRQFSFEIDARSIITSPSYRAQLEPGWLEIRGIAWSGRGRIERVEVSTDGGKRWQTAQLQGPVLPKAHTRFGLPWRWDGRATELLSRAIDETGYVQPTLREILKRRGPGSGPYHFNPITGWEVRGDGELRFSPTA